MATENETAMHVTETKTLYSTLNIIKSKSEEISKEKEEELLYGNNEDGDEEALSDDQSDDSIRLRISGSEDETKVPASEDVNKITKQSEPTIMGKLDKLYAKYLVIRLSSFSKNYCSRHSSSEHPTAPRHVIGRELCDQNTHTGTRTLEHLLRSSSLAIFDCHWLPVFH